MKNIFPGRCTVGCPLLQVCTLGWVKCREHISLLIILCIIVYVTNKAHLSLICLFVNMAVEKRTASPLETSRGHCGHLQTYNAEAAAAEWHHVFWSASPHLWLLTQHPKKEESRCKSGSLHLTNKNTLKPMFTVYRWVDKSTWSIAFPVHYSFTASIAT